MSQLLFSYKLHSYIATYNLLRCRAEIWGSGLIESIHPCRLHFPRPRTQTLLLQVINLLVVLFSSGPYCIMDRFGMIVSGSKLRFLILFCNTSTLHYPTVMTDSPESKVMKNHVRDAIFFLLWEPDMVFKNLEMLSGSMSVHAEQKFSCPILFVINSGRPSCIIAVLSTVRYDTLILLSSIYNLGLHGYSMNV